MAKIVADIHSRFVEIAAASFEALKQRIADNIRRKGKWASGKTAESMAVQSERGERKSTVTLVGRPDFETLETGNPPANRPAREFRDILYQWSKAKGIPFKEDRERWWFAYRMAGIINGQGDRQYRSGKRADVYSTAAQESADAINEAINKEVGALATTITTQILNAL